jgi:hypothetical protein
MSAKKAAHVANNGRRSGKAPEEGLAEVMRIGDLNERELGRCSTANSSGVANGAGHTEPYFDEEDKDHRGEGNSVTPLVSPSRTDCRRA